MVAFAGRKYAARSPLAFVANDTYTVTSFTLVRIFDSNRWCWSLSFTFMVTLRILRNFVHCRCSSLRRAGFKTCIGRGTGAPNAQGAQGTLTSSASTSRIVLLKHPAAKTVRALWIAALEYNWHSLAQISTFRLSTLGMKLRTFVSTHSMAYIQISGTLSVVSTARYSNCAFCSL